MLVSASRAHSRAASSKNRMFQCYVTVIRAQKLPPAARKRDLSSNITGAALTADGAKMVSRLLSRLSTLSGLWTLQTALCRLHSGVCSNLYAVSGLQRTVNSALFQALFVFAARRSRLESERERSERGKTADCGCARTAPLVCPGLLGGGWRIDFHHIVLVALSQLLWRASIGPQRPLAGRDLHH